MLSTMLDTAEQGDAEAQFCLSVCYDKGTGVIADKMETAKWLQKASEQGPRQEH